MSEQVTNNQPLSQSVNQESVNQEPDLKGDLEEIQEETNAQSVVTNNTEINNTEINKMNQVSEKVQGSSEEVTTVKSTEELIDTLQKENTQLKQQLAEQNGQLESIKSQCIRIAADFDNFRKRTEKEKETQAYQVKKNTINELLSVIDNFERARTQLKPSTEGEKNIHKSYQGVYKILVDSLKRIGVSPMRPEGQEFDPMYHEAMLREPTDEYPEGTVIEELMRGYLLDDQVLRHAMVKVAAPKVTENSEDQKSKESEQ